MVSGNAICSFIWYLWHFCNTESCYSQILKLSYPKKSFTKFSRKNLWSIFILFQKRILQWRLLGKFMKFFRVTILMKLLRKSTPQMCFSSYSHSYFVKSAKQQCFPKTDLNISWADTWFNQYLYFIYKLVKLLSHVLVDSVFKLMSCSAKTLMFWFKDTVLYRKPSYIKQCI